MSTEDRFPTIADVHAVFADLVAHGLGALPVQVIVCPDSTMQAIARDAGAKDDAKPALMVEFEGVDGRIGVTVLSTERWEKEPARRSAVQ